MVEAFEDSMLRILTVFGIVSLGLSFLQGDADTVLIHNEIIKNDIRAGSMVLQLCFLF